MGGTYSKHEARVVAQEWQNCQWSGQSGRSVTCYLPYMCPSRRWTNQVTPVSGQPATLPFWQAFFYTINYISAYNRTSSSICIASVTCWRIAVHKGKNWVRRNLSAATLNAHSGALRVVRVCVQKGGHDKDGRIQPLLRFCLRHLCWPAAATAPSDTMFTRLTVTRLSLSSVIDNRLITASTCPFTAYLHTHR